MKKKILILIKYIRQNTFCFVYDYNNVRQTYLFYQPSSAWNKGLLFCVVLPNSRSTRPTRTWLVFIFPDIPEQYCRRSCNWSLETKCTFVQTNIKCQAIVTIQHWMMGSENDALLRWNIIDTNCCRLFFFKWGCSRAHILIYVDSENFNCAVWDYALLVAAFVSCLQHVCNLFKLYIYTTF